MKGRHFRGEFATKQALIRLKLVFYGDREEFLDPGDCLEAGEQDGKGRDFKGAGFSACMKLLLFGRGGRRSRWAGAGLGADAFLSYLAGNLRMESRNLNRRLLFYSAKESV